MASRLVIKLFPEILVKSRNLRRSLTKNLASNIRNLSRDLDVKVAVKELWDQLDVRMTNDSTDDVESMVERLSNMPGIDKIERIQRYPFSGPESIVSEVIEHNVDKISGKSFRVNVKRKGTHDFKSFELEQFLGGNLLQSVPSSRVDLHNPDVTVDVHINQDQADMVSEVIQGIGGFPMGTQGQVLSLLSGGFDSGVSSYMSMKRGFKTHFCFFNLGGVNHEIGVKQLADFLWRKYSFSHRVKFINVPFEPVVAEILKSVDHTHMGVILKRLMIQAANQISESLKAKALVTGESLAQVSSQTLPNLNLIDSVSEQLIIRPLIVSDKQEIIATAKRIGTESFALSMPEYCAVISDRPTSNAKLSKIRAEEEKFDYAVLEEAIKAATIEPIDRILEAVDTPFETQEIKTPAKSDVILDIRHSENEKPLPFTHNQVIRVPFYKVDKTLEAADESQRFLLYCERGVMSHMQAAQLQSKGFQNVMVLKAS